MTRERLSLIAPTLTRQMEAVSNEQVLRGAAYEAAAIVAGRAAVDDERVRRALQQLAEGQVDTVLRDDLAGLVAELDERAWDVQEARDAGRATHAQYLAAFARARAAGAVVAAMDPDPAMAALEAAYEAHCAFEDGSGVIDAVAASLSGSS